MTYISSAADLKLHVSVEQASGCCCYARVQCPLGVIALQVESAFEFAEMCRDIDYHNFLFSMKASNPLVMVQVTSAAHWKGISSVMRQTVSAALHLTCSWLQAQQRSRSKQPLLHSGIRLYSAVAALK